MRQPSLALPLLLAAAICCGQENSFPYTAYVQLSSTALRSGPGHEFYATDLLDWGSKLEVYRHDDQLWAAVRPPEGSFSWVPAQAVEPTDDPTLLRVVQEGCFTRVGTRYSQERSAEYVPLQAGELLEMLGQQSLSPGRGQPAQQWFKIAPPPGEFRWVRLDALDKTPPARQLPSQEVDGPRDAQDVAAALGPAGQLTDAPSNNPEYKGAWGGEISALTIPDELLAPLTRGPLSTDVGDEPPEPQTPRGEQTLSEAPTDGASPWSPTAVQPVQWSYALAPRTDSDLLSKQPSFSPWREVPRFSASPRVASATGLLPAALAAAPALDLGFPAAGPAASSALPRGSGAMAPIQGMQDKELLRLEIAEIELALAQTVLKPAGSWQLDPLRARAQAVIDASQIAEFRHEAHRMLAKIAQCEDLQRRQRQSSGGPSSGPAPLLPFAAQPPVTPSATGPGQPAYDGVGWLMPVVTHHEGLPRYVLADDAGQVLQFVTPQPGLNLQGYVRRKIGIFGHQSYLPSVQRPHLTAQRIVSLDRLRY